MLQDALPYQLIMLKTHNGHLYFMLVIKFVSDGIKNGIRNCKNMVKKSFWNTFYSQKLSKKVKYIRMSKEKHTKPYTFL